MKKMITLFVLSLGKKLNIYLTTYLMNILALTIKPDSKFVGKLFKPTAIGLYRIY